MMASGVGKKIQAGVLICDGLVHHGELSVVWCGWDAPGELDIHST